MRQVSVATAFTPANRTVDGTGIPGFSPARVLAILDTTARATLYDPVTPGLGLASVAGDLMTLEIDTTGMSASDNVLIVWDRATPTTTRTLVTLSANAPAQLVAANPYRRGLRWMNLGPSAVYVTPGAGPAQIGLDMAYDPPPTGAGPQGGSESFDASTPADAFQAISPGAATVIVWEIA